jgi:hypothetical protein
METFIVSRVSVLTANKTKNKRAVVMFNLESSDYPLIVSPKQALVMLQAGGLCMNQSIEDIYNSNDDAFSPEFVRTLNEVRNGDLVGDIELVREGDNYTLDASHPDVKNGSAKAGEIRKYKSTNLRIVTGSLPSVYPISQARLDAIEYAKAKVAAATPKRSFKKLVSIDEQVNEPAIFQTEE